MCGVAGLVSNKSDGFVDRRILQRMCRVLTHRGPDDEGYYLDERAGLGMRRLSIIDLTGGQQPVTDEQRRLWLVFNGEIYNYRELRRLLESRGHRFVSQSDTEVIVHAYEEYGDRCVSYLNGMFSFAIWDSVQHRLFLARDRLGIKPLYYWHSGDHLVFGSELKAILAHPDSPREVDLVALDHFLALEYVPSPHSIVKGVHKLAPGHTLIFEHGNLTLCRYWDVPHMALPDDEHALVEQLQGLLRDAVHLQMVSDVPVGAFLSGGIDSSTVVALMSRWSGRSVQTFSIGFDDPTYSELASARAVANYLGTSHVEHVLNPDIAELSKSLLAHFDEPFADFSIFPTYLVSKLARETVKVVLTGDGGDEIFAGYDTYLAQDYDRYYRRLPRTLREELLPALLTRVPPRPAKKGPINKLKRFVEGAALPASLAHARWMIFMTSGERQALYQPELRAAMNGHTPEALLSECLRGFAAPGSLAQQQYVDVKTYLADNILTKVDRMSMAVSLEARVPLLDHRIVEFALNLPPMLKLDSGKTKVILRKAMAHQLPQHVLEKPKQGFSIPLKHWLRGSLQPLMLDTLSYDTVNRRGYFDARTVQTWVAEHQQGRANHSHRLWALMVFELWLRHTIDQHKADYEHSSAQM